MWAAQVGRPVRRRTGSITLDLPGHGTLRHEQFTLDAAADAVAASSTRPPAAGRSSSGCRSAATSRCTSPRRSPGARPRRWSLAGATAEPVGLRAMPVPRPGWSIDRFDGPRLEARQPLVLPDAVPAGPRRADRRGRVLGARRRGGPALPRRPPLQAPLAAYPGPTLILNGSLDLPFRCRPAGVRARPRRMAGASGSPGATHLSNLDRPAAFNDAVRRFVDGSWPGRR